MSIKKIDVINLQYWNGLGAIYGNFSAVKVNCIDKNETVGVARHVMEMVHNIISKTCRNEIRITFFFIIIFLAFSNSM